MTPPIRVITLYHILGGISISLFWYAVSIYWRDSVVFFSDLAIAIFGYLGKGVFPLLVSLRNNRSVIQSAIGVVHFGLTIHFHLPIRSS